MSSGTGRVTSSEGECCLSSSSICHLAYMLLHSVNLGGWLVPEPFIVPSLFERYANSRTPAVDEYTLSQAMAADTANGGLAQLEEHYNTFIVRRLATLVSHSFLIHMNRRKKTLLRSPAQALTGSAFPFPSGQSKRTRRSLIWRASAGNTS